MVVAARLPELPVLGLSVPGELGTRLLPPGADQGALHDLVAHTGARFLLLGGSGPHVDPSVLAAVLRRRWTGEPPGLVTVAGPTRDHPYNLARRVLALDHFSGGRSGLALVTRDRTSATSARPGASAWTSTPEGPELTREFGQLLRGLWNTWPRESVRSDAAAGVFADSALIRRLDHEGSWSVRGPLNSPSSPQDEPVLFWWVRSGTAGRFPAGEFAQAAAVADVVLIPADRVPARRPESAAGVPVLAVVGPNPDLAGRDWLDGVVLDARSLPQDVPAGTPRSEPLWPGTLRQTLGLKGRRIDLSDRAPAFGGVL